MIILVTLLSRKKTRSKDTTAPNLGQGSELKVFSGQFYRIISGCMIATNCLLKIQTILCINLTKAKANGVDIWQKGGKDPGGQLRSSNFSCSAEPVLQNFTEL